VYKNFKSKGLQYLSQFQTGGPVVFHEESSHHKKLHTHNSIMRKTTKEHHSSPALRRKAETYSISLPP